MLVAGLILVNAAVIGVCSIAYWAVGAAPRSGDSHRRQLERRRSLLRENPDQVTSLDVELLLAESMPCARAAEVCQTARAHHIPALVLWTWVELYDAELAALAVESGMTRDEMVHHMTTGTAPDRRSLEIFAAFRGAVAS
ncbi:hypothetical protein GCM10009844_33070 [Nocardioides koreensis]|uniref:Uncharacterized protein n=1 Tax=Nocardioides koreensis TaxID=433651 RepID=A0ABN3A0Z3_9ACTN